MKKAKIILFGNPILGQRAEDVRAFHKKLHGHIDTIAATLKETEQGAALAANQIALLKRITVIDYMDEYFEMINPEILSSSGTQTGYEGCLSFPGWSGRVTRAETVQVRFADRRGKERVIERSGPMARCLQHEIDHLNGVLFIDRMEDGFLFGDEKDTSLAVDDLRKMMAVSPEGVRPGP